MSVMIGHASISETGGVNGSKGDSTGKEVCTRTWYSKPWDFVAIHPDATVREKHAKAIEDACANDCIGYGQGNRNTANTEAKKVGYVISKIKTKCNTDCSALQNLAAVVSGAQGVTYGPNGWTTSTMLRALLSAGYIVIAKSSSIPGYSNLSKEVQKKVIVSGNYLLSADYCVRGAIYVKSGSHTVCGLTNGTKANQTLSKAGISNTAIAPVDKTEKDLKPTYRVGTVYTTQTELKVRTGAGTSYSAKKHEQLTDGAKSNDKDKDGAIDKGTRVTCKATKAVGDDIWMQIPSGWIAAYYNGKVYVK